MTRSLSSVPGEDSSLLARCLSSLVNETGVTVGGEGPKRKIFHFIWSFKSMHNFLMHPRQEFLNCCFNERSISFVIQRLPNIEKKHRSYLKRGQ